jgi:hypothetical protein
MCPVNRLIPYQVLPIASLPDAALTTPTANQTPFFPHQQIIALALQQINGEKISAARIPGSAIIGYEEVFFISCGAMPFGYCALRGLRKCKLNSSCHAHPLIF